MVQIFGALVGEAKKRVLCAGWWERHGWWLKEGNQDWKPRHHVCCATSESVFVQAGQRRISQTTKPIVWATLMATTSQAKFVNCITLDSIAFEKEVWWSKRLLVLRTSVAIQCVAHQRFAISWIVLFFSWKYKVVMMLWRRDLQVLNIWRLHEHGVLFCFVIRRFGLLRFAFDS